MKLKSTLSKYSGKSNSLFSKIFITFFFAYFPFLILFIILASIGVLPVNFNGEKIYGLKAVIVLICFTPFLILMFSAFAYFWFIFGNFILRIFISILPNKED